MSKRRHQKKVWHPNYVHTPKPPHPMPVWSKNLLKKWKTVLEEDQTKTKNKIKIQRDMENDNLKIHSGLYKSHP